MKKRVTPVRSDRIQRTAVLAPVLAALVSGLLALTPASAPAGPAGPVAYAAACNYYQNRARFRPREARVEFLVLLAEGCDAALRSLRRGSEIERRAAAGFLARIVRLRDEVIRINISRVYGVEYGPRSMPRTGSGRLMSLGGVSETGEYLMAREMGLMAAFRDWRGQAPGFSLALK